jgi:hypothetical protein
VIDAEFDRDDHGLILYNCDREETETTLSELTSKPKPNSTVVKTKNKIKLKCDKIL